MKYQLSNTNEMTMDFILINYFAANIKSQDIIRNPRKLYINDQVILKLREIKQTVSYPMTNKNIITVLFGRVRMSRYTIEKS